MGQYGFLLFGLLMFEIVTFTKVGGGSPIEQMIHNGTSNLWKMQYNSSMSLYVVLEEQYKEIVELRRDMNRLLEASGKKPQPLPKNPSDTLRMRHAQAQERMRQSQKKKQ